MSDFRQQLRGSIYRKEERARHAARAAEDQRDARRERLQEADATAEALLGRVFRPLVDDFRAVMDSEGVLRDSCLVCETSEAKGKRTGTRGTSTSGNTNTKKPRRPTVADFRRFLAWRAERGLPELPAERQPEEFERFLAEEHERETLAAELAARPVPAWRRLTCRAVARADSSLLYEVRLFAAAGDDGRVELWAEALRGAACDFRRDSPPPLVELPRKTIAADGTDADLARRWCARVLSKCAEALMEANFGCTPAAAVHAPLCAVPAGVPIDVPAMV